jgi:hypothetical protein
MDRSRNFQNMKRSRTTSVVTLSRAPKAGTRVLLFKPLSPDPTHEGHRHQRHDLLANPRSRLPSLLDSHGDGRSGTGSLPLDGKGTTPDVDQGIDGDAGRGRADLSLRRSEVQELGQTLRHLAHGSFLGWWSHALTKHMP